MKQLKYLSLALLLGLQGLSTSSTAYETDQLSPMFHHFEESGEIIDRIINEGLD